MTNEPVHVPQLPAPGRVGQGTAVEQTRAAAEVLAVVQVAQQCPRVISTARAEMQQSCQQHGLAERAFYRYPRGGQSVSGPSVHLARELARCWGNVQYGVAELRRDDEYGQSEMLAFAWDVQTNARSSLTFIVPHKRYTGGQDLTDLRDVYENNANVGARRLREAIFSILPPWFTEEAAELCNRTLERGDGKSLAERVADAVKVFDGMGVAKDRLEQKLGRPAEKWSAFDLAQLMITHRSLRRGEITVDEEFPQPRVTTEEITGAATAKPGKKKPADDKPRSPVNYTAEEIAEMGGGQ